MPKKSTKQSAGQKKTVKRVMHEYKHGDLKSGSGKKVKSRKQAIAIGLKEAGASKYQSKSAKRRSGSGTKKTKTRRQASSKRKTR